MTAHVLLVESPDQSGLVHLITGVLYRRGTNILSNHEFVDVDSRRFFMRTEFEGNIETDRVVQELEAALPRGATVQLPKQRRRRIAVLATREHHCLADLLVRQEFGELNAEIIGVVSNHDSLRSLVERFGIPFHFLTHEGRPREQHEAEVLQLLDSLQPELLVLAKYMRVLSPQFVSRWGHRIVNIHHSFLPAFIGARPYHQAFQRGVKVIGATAHFVTDQLDEGPIIVQQVIPVDHAFQPQDLARAGRDVEQMVLARALKLVLEDRVFLNGHRTVIFE